MANGPNIFQMLLVTKAVLEIITGQGQGHMKTRADAATAEMDGSS